MKRAVGWLKEKSELLKPFILKIVVALLITTTYGAFIYSIWVSQFYATCFLFLALSFSALSLSLTVILWILVMAKLFSTHRVELVDINSASRNLKRAKNFAAGKKPPSQMDEEELDDIDPLKTFAQNAAEKLFGLDKESLTDNIA